jgi:hypothetical protein
MSLPASYLPYIRFCRGTLGLLLPDILLPKGALAKVKQAISNSQRAYID